MNKKTGREKVIEYAEGAKAFVAEADEGPLPDEVLLRAAVVFHQLERVGKLGLNVQVGLLDEFERSYAIAMIAAGFADQPASTPYRAALFRTMLRDDYGGPEATQPGRTDEPTLPAKHAHVHALGHRTFVGPVTPLGKGYRVEHHEVDGPDGEEVVTRTVVDVFAVHSVEYISDADWTDLLFKLEQSAAKDREQHRRETTMPEGYTPLLVEGHHGYRCPDGLEKLDGYWDRRGAHLAAWRDMEVRAGLALRDEEVVADGEDEDDVPHLDGCACCECAPDEAQGDVTRA